MADTDNLLARLEKLLDRIELLIPSPAIALPQPVPPAMRWQHTGWCQYFETVTPDNRLQPADLLCIDRQKQTLLNNTRQFLHGLPANHVLLCGPRGTGKSSLVKSLVMQYGDSDLVLIEVGRDDVQDLPTLCRSISGANQRFILFCDDLSFAPNEIGYKSLKVLLDGSISQLPENMLIYATSNRRHLLPEYMAENTHSEMLDGEIHLHESLEEKLSLSERFGLWLSFEPFNQQQFLTICQHWLKKLGAEDGDNAQTRQAALQWALERGSRSGRSAWQFASDWTGRQRLKNR